MRARTPDRWGISSRIFHVQKIKSSLLEDIQEPDGEVQEEVQREGPVGDASQASGIKAGQK